MIPKHRPPPAASPSAAARRDPDVPAIVRGIILLLLADAGLSTPLLERELWMRVEEQVGAINDRYWRDHLAYLELQGYVEARSSEIHRSVITRWVITPKGINLADRRIDPDPGVDLGQG